MPRMRNGNKKGERPEGRPPMGPAGAPEAHQKSAAHERNALSSHGLAPQYFRRRGA